MKHIKLFKLFIIIIMLPFFVTIYSGVKSLVQSNKNVVKLSHEKTVGIVHYSEREYYDEDGESYTSRVTTVNYEVNGEKYTYKPSVRVSYSTTKKYPDNSEVEVYYKANNPSDSVVPDLITKSQAYIRIGEGVFIEGIFLIILLVLK